MLMHHFSHDLQHFKNSPKYASHYRQFMTPFAISIYKLLSKILNHIPRGKNKAICITVADLEAVNIVVRRPKNNKNREKFY